MLKYGIFGMLILLIVILTVSYYFNHEGFAVPAAAVPAVPVAPAAPLLSASSPLASVPRVPAPVAASPSDLSNGSSLVPMSSKAAGPAPANGPMGAPPSPAALGAPGVSAAAAGALQQVALSQTGAAAGELQQKSDLLSSIQTIVRNELHTNRTMDTETQNGSDESCEDTHATSQGKEYSAAHGKPDMSQYIKKDQIPCWGCSLDY